MIKKVNLSIVCFLLATVLMMITPVLAANESNEESKEEILTEEYVVTATRIPQSLGEAPGMTETISGEEVDKGIDSVSQVLMDHGLAFTINGGEFSFARLQMDGVNDSRLQYLVNGVPINPDRGGSVDLSLFPTAGLEKIEVAHGPLSALYGANALGGVVNIITDLTGEPRNTLSLDGGSFASRRWGAAVERQKWGLAVGGSVSDGYRDHSAAEGYYLSGQFDLIQEGEEYLTLRGNYMSKDAQQPGHLTFGGQGEQYDQRYLLDVSGKAYWLEGVWEYKLYTQKQEMEYEDLVFMSTDIHTVDNYGLDVAALYEVGNHEILAGSTFEVDCVDSTRSGRRTMDNLGLYFQDLWYAAEDLMLLTGLRWDYNSQYKAALSPRMSITKFFAEDLSISFGYGEAFRAPTISDLYDAFPEWSYYGNPDLKPEKSKRFDLIGNWRTSRGSLMVNIYRALIRDGIAITDDWSSMINISEVKINGLNMNLEKTLTSNLTGRLGYAWLERMELNKNTEEYSRKMPYGEDRWELGLTYKRNNFTSGLNWQLVSGRSTLPDHCLLNLDAKYRINQALLLNLAVENLTDEEYQIEPGYPMPGRSFSAGLSYQF